jgi:predicted outer membrane protein
MKQLLSLAALGMALALGSAHAADETAPAKPPTKQQTKMGTCNKEATGMKGDERKAFMKSCLSNKPEAEATQQSKMKTCNAEAAGKKGAERKTFMSECLKK